LQELKENIRTETASGTR